MSEKEKRKEKKKESQMGLKTKKKWNGIEEDQKQHFRALRNQHKAYHCVYIYVCVRCACFERYLLIEKTEIIQHTCSVFYILWVLPEIVPHNNNNNKNHPNNKGGK